jgi:hypothetical protein
MFFTFWVFVFFATGFVTLVLVGHPGWAAISYALAGLFWMLHDVTRPTLYVPILLMSRMGRILVVLLWPLRVSHAALKKWKELRDPIRFAVTYGGQLRKEYEIQEFPNLKSALDFARQKSAEIGEAVHLSDRANFYWGTDGEWHYLLYLVLPAGEFQK